MKGSGIVLLALLMCFGGTTPMVLAEEIETEPEEVTVEEVQDEVTDEAETSAGEEADEAEEADVTEDEEAVSEEEIAAEAVQEESADEETAEEQKQPRSNYEVLPTKHGTVSISSNRRYLQGHQTDFCMISCIPDEGYSVASVKALDDKGRECTLEQDDHDNYRFLINDGDFVTIEVLFEETYKVLPTEHGTVNVSTISEDTFHRGEKTEWLKISCIPDEGYRFVSIKALDGKGRERYVAHDEEGYFYVFKDKEGIIALEAVFDRIAHKLYTRANDAHDVTFMVDGSPVTEARAGQTVQVGIRLNSYEYVSYTVIDSPKYEGYTLYDAKLISETEDYALCEFKMIDDDIKLGIGYGTRYVDENGEIYKHPYINEINSSKNLTLTTGTYIVNGDVTIDKRVEINGDVDIILADDKTFTCKEGIHNSEGNSLTIWGQKKGNGYLNVKGASWYKAGIGGNDNENGGTFILHGGRVDSEGGKDAAGVGGGINGNGGKISVYGGYLHGHGNNNAAGIGGGEYGRGGDIRIYGGEVYGEGDRHDFTDRFNAGGAGIGGGEDRDGGYIEINGGTVNALGGYGRYGSGAGIGGGDDGNGGIIVINGGDITASSDHYDNKDDYDAAGIGGGYNNGAGSITINGGIIDASSTQGAGIGSGRCGSGGSIHIKSGTINASSSEGAGIGGAKFGDTGVIDISGGTITSHSDRGVAIGYTKDKSQIHLAPNMLARGEDYAKRYEAVYSNKDITLYETQHGLADTNLILP